MGQVVIGSAAPAEAATKYSSCTKLRKEYPKGIAKKKSAAIEQDRAGFYTPKVRLTLYKANKPLDRDSD